MSATDMTPHSTRIEPDAVVLGFDRTLTFERICEAAWWISRGKPYLATHPDMICPTNEETVLVDTGAVIAALAKATGRKPDVIPGKPDPRMLDGICKRHGLKRNELAMVGDRLYTDMAMAQRAGALGVLVLTGEATRHRSGSDAGDARLGPCRPGRVCAVN